MDIIYSDFKKGIAHLRIRDLDDLWYLSNIIEPGDYLKGQTTRKIKIGSEESAKSIKKNITLKIKVEKVEFHPSQDSLRAGGKVIEGPEDVPLGSHHTLSLEINKDFFLEKPNWLFYQKEKLKQSAQKKYSFLLCILDREEAIFALSKRQGQEILLNLRGEVPKKNREENTTKKDFFAEIISLLKEYNARYAPENIILAGPAFFKEVLFKQITELELKKKIVVVNCNSVTENAVNEVMKRPELQQTLEKSRSRQEMILVEDLLSEINKNGLASYGFKEVLSAVEAGAVSQLLVSDFLIHEFRQENKFDELDKLMKKVEQIGGKVHLISGEHEGGKKLKGLGGIGALLRYHYV